MDISISSYDQLPTKYMLGFYYPADFDPYSNDKYPQNSEFNGYSEMILDMKDNYEYAINNFYKNLSSTLSDVRDIAIVTPPTNSVGIESLARMLATNNKEITYLNSYFGRYGKREIYSNNKYSIDDQKTILLDDVVTTGETMERCKALLLDSGAKEVKCITLGRTWRNIEEAYSKLEKAYNLKNSQDDTKFFLRLTDLLQKSADILSNLGDCSNHNRAIVYKTASKVQDDLESLNECRNESGYILVKEEEKAKNVIDGSETFDSYNIFQSLFLW